MSSTHPAMLARELVHALQEVARGCFLIDEAPGRLARRSMRRALGAVDELAGETDHEYGWLMKKARERCGTGLLDALREGMGGYFG